MGTVGDLFARTKRERAEQKARDEARQDWGRMLVSEQDAHGCGMAKSNVVAGSTCLRCGLLVGDYDVHDAWHERIGGAGA
jgi:hypothetical protein